MTARPRSSRLPRDGGTPAKVEAPRQSDQDDMGERFLSIKRVKRDDDHVPAAAESPVVVGAVEAPVDAQEVPETGIDTEQAPAPTAPALLQIETDRKSTR